MKLMPFFTCSSLISNLINDSCSLRWCINSSCFFLSYYFFCSAIHPILIMDLEVEWKSFFHMKLLKDFPILESELGKAMIRSGNNVNILCSLPRTACCPSLICCCSSLFLLLSCFIYFGGTGVWTKTCKAGTLLLFLFFKIGSH
jgi:hypothetical protein